MIYKIERNNKDGLQRIRNYLEYINIQFSNELNIYDIKNYSDKLFKFAETFFLINERNEDIGMCSIYINDDTNKILYISTISVKKEYLSNGLGQVLLNHIFEIKNKYKMNYIKLEVNKNNNQAIRFYKKNRFTIFEEKLYSFIMIS